MAYVKCELGGSHSACDKCKSVTTDSIYVEPPWQLKQNDTYHQVVVCTPCYISLFPFARNNQETSTNEH